MNLVQVLQRQVTERPDATAIIDVCCGRTRALSFGDLERDSQRAATLLRQAGLKPGDAVLIFQPMSIELYVALVAVFRLGLVAMFLDPSAGQEHIGRCCEIQPPRAFIASAKAHLLRLRSSALRRIPRKFSIGFPVPGAVSWSRWRNCSPTHEVYGADPSTPALLTFTSGSTGQPKAALRTHGFLLAQHRVLEKSLHLVPGQMDLTTLPIFLLANLASGVTSLIPRADLRFPGAVDPRPIAAQIDQHQATRTAASPAFLERLVNYGAVGEMPSSVDASSPLAQFEKIYVGGAPVFPPLLQRLKRAAPKAQVVAVYGSTEAEPIAEIELSCFGPDDFSAMLNGRGLLAGVPVERIQLRIIRDQWGTPLGNLNSKEFESLCLPAEASGEIVVAGEHVLGGYLHGRGDEETKFSAGGQRWHRTGDAGSLDRQGRLWLLGRCSACIHDSAGTLYPFTVECAASHFPGVRRSAMIAHEGRRVLVIEALPGIDLYGLKASLTWAHIDDTVRVEQLPVDRRHNAKIDYPALREMLKAGTAGRF